VLAPCMKPRERENPKERRLEKDRRIGSESRDRAEVKMAMARSEQTSLDEVPTSDCEGKLQARG
jgi:hypothetical protein